MIEPTNITNYNRTQTIEVWNQYQDIHHKVYNALEELEQCMNSDSFQKMKEKIKEFKLDEENYWYHETFESFINQLHEALGY